ncbi:DUF5753 domain-containing protein [Streptomyces chrestomyceticus]|uniref:DUF5753 domain-containing protein n=1 Tax=Streptomyces chrestomyceticus TaxID=68185 RepID=UPI0033C19148
MANVRRAGRAHFDVSSPRLLPRTAAVEKAKGTSTDWHPPGGSEQFVRVRLARQERLTHEPRLTMWPVVAEGVLLHQADGPTVVRTRLEHLAAMAEEPNVTVQALPFSRGAYAGMFGLYLLLSFPRRSALDAVRAANPTGAAWLEREPEMPRYRDLFADARTSALSPAESAARIKRIAKEPRA